MTTARIINKIAEHHVSLHQLFNHIARIYDLMSSMMSFGLVHYWRWRASRALRLHTGEIGLDLGTGTADFALALLRASDPHAHLIGIDYAPAMLTLGRSKLQRQGVTGQVELRIGNVEYLDLPDNSVDCCYSAFLLRNLTDLPQALREMLRVVRPHGHIVCLEISHPPCNLFRKLFYSYFYFCTPFFSTLLGQKLNANYLAQSLKNFHHASELKKIMESCGWHDVHYIHLTGGVVTLHIGMKWADRT
jgi:demethylmenaquinone methyltransferase/2-methoxy-6-polyprenyl-1,4-benzoquinol methylase